MLPHSIIFSFFWCSLDSAGFPHSPRKKFPVLRVRVTTFPKLCHRPSWGVRNSRARLLLQQSGTFTPRFLGVSFWFPSEPLNSYPLTQALLKCSLSHAAHTSACPLFSGKKGFLFPTLLRMLKYTKEQKMLLRRKIKSRGKDGFKTAANPRERCASQHAGSEAGCRLWKH